MCRAEQTSENMKQLEREQLAANAAAAKDPKDLDCMGIDIGEV